MPLPNILTDRLRLRERDSRDFEDCVTMDSDPEVMRFIRPDSSPDDERRFNEEVFAMDWPDGLGFWTITPRSDPDGFLGWIFLIPFEGDTTMADLYADVEIGYRLKRAAWGQGYASEAARTLVEHGFTEFAPATDWRRRPVPAMCGLTMS